MSGDKEQDYFADGLAEEIINALSKLSNVFVIAAKLLIQLQGQTSEGPAGAEEMGFSMCWRGAYAKWGDKVRITAQLVDALTGNHLMSERYERHLKDIFAIQTMSHEVLTSLRVK